MEIKQVAEVLARADLHAPLLNVLIPNEDNYSVLLMQPEGHINVSSAGVKNRERDLAGRQFKQFLTNARQTQADLVITPEYSMPWETLIAAIKEGNIPGKGKLWAFGCESIKYSEFEALKQDLAPVATVLHESLQSEPKKFTDPLAYVFVSPPVDGIGPPRTVMLVQFKTSPMGDNDHFEINNLQKGTCIYQFGGIGQTLKLVSLICSDVFAFKDAQAETIYDRALVVHIQLTPKPRQEQYRQYRERLFQFKGDATELICINWAKDVHEWSGDHVKPWHNISGSAWYLRPEQFDEGDSALCANHQHGLYYTWLASLRSHVLFFNYEPAIYLIQATKVAHIGVAASLSRRRGPLVTKAWIWNDTIAAWAERVAVKDGFSEIVHESGGAKDNLNLIANRNPLEAERVLALCAGEVCHSDEWYSARQLDSCSIDSTEVIHRITFCQDTDLKASTFRVARLKRCGHLWEILKSQNTMPAALADFHDGFCFEWSSDFPHQNAISAKGQRATVIYMGEESSVAQVEAIAKRALEFVGRWFAEPDKSHSARQRVAVWYRDNGNVVSCNLQHLVRYDNPGDTSEFDIGRQA
jgi:hypothetical protein